MSPQLMAHRGASHDAPENTRAAFLRAVDLGARIIELDVQLTADDRLVVLHDPRVERTSDGSGAARDLTLEELRRLRYDRTHPGMFPDEHIGILEFREAVDFMADHDLDLNVETKEHGPLAGLVNDLVAGTLREARWEDRTLVSSINHSAMAQMRQQHPHLRTAIAFVERFVDLPAYARSCGASVLHPHHGLVDEQFVTIARDAGFGINVWTVDDPTEAHRVMALAIDGMMTNRPDIFELDTQEPLDTEGASA